MKSRRRRRAKAIRAAGGVRKFTWRGIRHSNNVWWRSQKLDGTSYRPLTLTMFNEAFVNLTRRFDEPQYLC